MIVWKSKETRSRRSDRKYGKSLTRNSMGNRSTREIETPPSSSAKTRTATTTTATTTTTTTTTTMSRSPSRRRSLSSTGTRTTVRSSRSMPTSDNQANTTTTTTTTPEKDQGRRRTRNESSPDGRGRRRTKSEASSSRRSLPSRLIPNFSGKDAEEKESTPSTRKVVKSQSASSPRRGGKNNSPRKRQDSAPTTEKKKRKEQDIIPLEEDPLYKMKVSSTVERHFYDGVVVHSRPHVYDAEDFQHADPRWKVHVGDLIAVGVKPSNPPAKKPYPRKSIWYPFTSDWSPGQVIAIWQDRTKRGKTVQFGHFQMRVRWLYRLQDLERDDAEDVVEEIQKTKDLHPQKTVYETFVNHEVPVSTAIGKLVVTSWDVHMMIGQYTDKKTGIPQTHYVCNQRLDEHDNLVGVMDWKDYGEPQVGTLPAPLLRGLECPNTETQQNKKLKQAYIKCITERWKEMIEQEEEDEEEDEEQAEERESLSSSSSSTVTCSPPPVIPKGKSIEPKSASKSLTSPSTTEKQTIDKGKQDKGSTSTKKVEMAKQDKGSKSTKKVGLQDQADLNATQDKKKNESRKSTKENNSGEKETEKGKKALPKVVTRKGDRQSKAAEKEVLSQISTNSEKPVVEADTNLKPTRKRRDTQAEPEGEIVFLQTVGSPVPSKSKVSVVTTSAEQKGKVDSTVQFEPKVLAKKRTRLSNGKSTVKEKASNDRKRPRKADEKKNISEKAKAPKDLSKAESDRQNMSVDVVESNKSTTSKKSKPSGTKRDRNSTESIPAQAGAKKKATACRNRKSLGKVEIPPPVESVLYSTTSSKTRREFLKQANIQVRANTCAPRIIATRDHGKLWQLTVGDIVCIENPDAGEQALHIRKKHIHRPSESRLWYPFVKPWSICQVLCIYRDVVLNKGQESKSDTWLEVRWFPRESELSRVAQKMIPFQLDGEFEEVFEGDNVETRLAASKVLGRAEIFGYLNKVINVAENSTHDLTIPAPTIQCRCNYFVYQPEIAARFQPLFCSGSVPEMWFHRMIQRGNNVSLLMKMDNELKNASSRIRKNTFDLFSELQDEGDMDVSTETPYHSVSLSGSNKDREYFTSLEISPYWDSFHLSSLIWHASDRVNHKKDLRWKISVGDVVAVGTDEDSASIPTFASKEAPWYPFSEPWSPCQILAIYRDTSGNAAGENVIDDILMEVRWFYREADIEEGMNSLVKFSRLKEESKMEILFETDDVETQTTPLSAVLGPVALIASNAKKFNAKDDITDQVPPFMPLALHMYGGRYNVLGSKMKLKASKQKANHFEPKDMVKRGLDLSTHYHTRKDKYQIIELLHGKDESDHDFSDDDEDENPESTTETATVAGIVKRAKDNQLSSRGSSQQEHSTDANKENEVQCQQAVNDFIDDDGGPGLIKPKSREKQNQGNLKSKSSAKDTEGAEEDADEKRILIPGTVRPYHQDLSSLKSYYTEIDILPPYGNYEKGKFVRSQDKNKAMTWRVKLGDFVALHWEDGAGTNSNSGTISNSKYSPYTVPWGLGEIVTIWKAHSCKEDMEVGSGAGSSNAGKKGNIMVEFRWIYRKDELPGSLQLKSVSDEDNEYEEVIESDHLEDCNATSLLAPINLHGNHVISEQPKNLLGIPVLNFHCRRFWSIHRKALVPCGDLSSMGARGRMHSRYLGKDQVLKAALNKALNITEECELEQATNQSIQPAKVSVSDAFREVIKKLSLTDASEETNVLGLTLTGREKEQDRIMKFLRSAIIGEASLEGDKDYTDEPKQASVKSSIFIAGPPGTGKTACVRSVIERLRHEQADGSLPEFDFISLNGMEMRHPFEAYVKFWEALSGAKKDKRAPDVAASFLERHFSQNSHKDKLGVAKSPVTVLLLDEIDYLVTKKQTVLYNFFDWPLRTSQNTSGHRLVVVGISNTLNLPERLKPSVQSRLGGERCDFQSYAVDAMVKILNIKIAQESANAPAVFDKDAILFAARKTAAVSGDVRKALQICKSAAEAVLMEMESEAGSSVRRPEIVRISDVQKITRESFSSVISKAVSNSTPFEALLLVTLASLSRTSGRGTGGFDMKEVMTKMESIAGGSGDLQYTPAPTIAETIDMLHRLGESRIVSLHTPKSSSTTFRAAQGGSGGAWPLISLPMEDSNVLSALRDSPHNALAEKYLGRAGLW